MSSEKMQKEKSTNVLRLEYPFKFKGGKHFEYLNEFISSVGMKDQGPNFANETLEERSQNLLPFLRHSGVGSLPKTTPLGDNTEYEGDGITSDCGNLQIIQRGLLLKNNHPLDDLLESAARSDSAEEWAKSIDFSSGSIWIVKWRGEKPDPNVKPYLDWAFVEAVQPGNPEKYDNTVFKFRFHEIPRQIARELAEDMGATKNGVMACKNEIRWISRQIVLKSVGSTIKFNCVVIPAVPHSVFLEYCGNPVEPEEEEDEDEEEEQEEDEEEEQEEEQEEDDIVEVNDEDVPEQETDDSDDDDNSAGSKSDSEPDEPVDIKPRTIEDTTVQGRKKRKAGISASNIIQDSAKFSIKASTRVKVEENAGKYNKNASGVMPLNNPVIEKGSRGTVPVTERVEKIAVDPKATKKPKVETPTSSTSKVAETDPDNASQIDSGVPEEQDDGSVSVMSVDVDEAKQFVDAYKKKPTSKKSANVRAIAKQLKTDAENMDLKLPEGIKISLRNQSVFRNAKTPDAKQAVYDTIMNIEAKKKKSKGGKSRSKPKPEDTDDMPTLTEDEPAPVKKTRVVKKTVDSGGPSSLLQDSVDFKEERKRKRDQMNGLLKDFNSKRIKGVDPDAGLFFMQFKTKAEFEESMAQEEDKDSVTKKRTYLNMLAAYATAVPYMDSRIESNYAKDVVDTTPKKKAKKVVSSLLEDGYEDEDF